MTVRRVAPGAVHGRVRAPPSKSYTHRGYVVGHLASRPFRIEGPLHSADTEATRHGLASLGSTFQVRAGGWLMAPARSADRSPGPPVVRCGESGTTFRLLLAVAATSERRVRLDGRPQLRRRPIEGLLAPLERAGLECHRPRIGSLPLTVQGPIRPGRFVVDGATSSQYVSALLMVLPVLPGRSVLEVRGRLVSAPYVLATEAVLRAHGIRFRRAGHRWSIPGGQSYRGSRFAVPGDASSAAYLWAAGALAGGPVTVEGVPRDWPQADRAILRVLRDAGATVHETSDGASVRGPLARGFDVDLTDSPDLFPLAGALAASIPARSRLRGAPHLEFKESDRRTATTRLVRSLGATVRSGSSGLVIEGNVRLRPLRHRGWDDHRMVMSAAVAALAGRAPSEIGDARAVAKSFPDFWRTLQALGARTRSVR